MGMPSFFVMEKRLVVSSWLIFEFSDPTLLSSSRAGWRRFGRSNRI
jgi:hypothetical protein